MIQLRANYNKGSFIPLLLTGVILFGLIYFGLTFWHLSALQRHDALQVQNHAVIIADDLWNLNNSGMRAYLDLVARTDHYKTMEVLTNGGESFLKLQGPPQVVVDRILLRIGFISTEHISLPVYYNGGQIGVLQGEKYLRYFYPLVYIFLSLFFFALTLVFILYLIYNRRLLEQQVRERTRKYQELVDLLPEMVLETDERGIITFANETSQERLGISNLAKSEHDCKEYIRLENGVRGNNSLYMQVSNERNHEKSEYRARGASGELFPVLVRSAPIYENDQFKGARMVVVDITERKALEEQLNRDQKMKSIGMMAGGVAHDLNNILSGIVNYPELILHQIPKDSSLIKLIKPMKDAGLRAAAVVEDLLTVARGVAATKETVKLNDIILDYTESPEFKRLESLYPNILYTINLSPKSNSISCSIIHVRKCLMNLVINATEAVQGTGQVTIETVSRTVETLTTTSHGTITPGAYEIISVKDSGSGIPPHVLSNIFEPFYSKKELGRSGTGLGLTIVWNTMKDHDGGIQVTSTEKGSVFELYFTSSPESAKELTSPKSVDMFMGRGESILIVDDEFHQRDIALQLLESLGYNVEAVATGKAAIDYVQKTKVDLVILDMILESGINGLQTYEAIIQIHPGQKALIISGFSDSDDVKNTIHLGAGGLVKKPYTKEHLARAVFNELAWNNS